MGKAKFISIRKANRNDDNVPNYVSYGTLANHINNIDIGVIKDVKTDFGHDLEGEESGEGVYRPLIPYVQRISKFYLNVYKQRNDEMKQFKKFPKKSEDSFQFLINFGGDGAPGSGTAFLFSFLNVGQRLMSSRENFLVFGAFCKENCTLVRRYIAQIVTDLKYLENNIFEIKSEDVTVNVEYKVAELSNDMKMLCFLAGELSNSAHYFSTFANVNKADCSNINKNIGDRSSDWKPYSFKQRIEDSVKVQRKCQELSKLNSTKATKRSKLTAYIKDTLKSRQEFPPVIDNFIDRAKSEPLHLKNNIVKEVFIKLLKVAISQTNLGNVKTFTDLPEDTPLFKFCSYIKSDMSCNYLVNKLGQWFNESGGKVEKDFTFRFRGKESFAFLQSFPSLIKILIDHIKQPNSQQRLHQLFLQFLHLRHIVSFIARIESFDETSLTSLQHHCQSLFKLCIVYDLGMPSPSLWAICKAVPYHAKITLADYGFGLGVNSMEGREQKHQSIQKYSHNTTVQNRWPLIFRHEYIQLVHLRENGYDDVKYNTRVKSYIPHAEENSCLKCFLVKEEGKDVCFFL